MGYPFSWSTVQIYYNPKYVKTKPDSWHALLDTKYKGKISLENIPTDMMAIAGRATGAKKPYSMTTAEISQAKDFLKALKPNVLKLASQNNEVVRALADGSAWIGITNLGTDDRVKDAGGPIVKTAYPKEGTIGFIDSEQIVKASKNHDAFFKFENAMQQAPWIAKNFLTNGRPLFNEKAYKILVNQGHGDRARRLLLQQAGERPEDDDQGPGRRRAGLRRRLQRGVRRLTDEQHGARHRRTAADARRRSPPPRARLSGLAQYAGFVPALVLFGLFFVVAARADRRLQLLGDGRLQRRPRLDARQLPLLLQRLDLRPRRCGRRSGCRSSATAITIAIAFPFTYWLVRYVPRQLQRLLLVLVILPFWTSYLLRVYSWLNILGDGGAINRFLAVDARSPTSPSRSSSTTGRR